MPVTVAGENSEAFKSMPLLTIAGAFPTGGQSVLIQIIL